MAQQERTCCVSIDVDPIDCYYRIHSLGTPPAGLRSRILCAALPRYATLFSKKGISATFFVVAKDIDVNALGNDAIAMRAALREVRDLGHEIANHSYHHPYDLARFGKKECADEISRAHELLTKFVRGEVYGFRAPGYDLSPVMMAHLTMLGYKYDSSIFPAPGYYIAKLLVMGVLRVTGRRSGAVITQARALTAPIDPYRPNLNTPWKRGDADIIELPIAVTRRTRTPVIGTNLLMAPSFLRSHWLRSMSTRPFFNLEMHGIDFCDAKQDSLPIELIARQPDLRIPVQTKVERLGAILDSIEALGFNFSTLLSYTEGVNKREGTGFSLSDGR